MIFRLSQNKEKTADHTSFSVPRTPFFGVRSHHFRIQAPNIRHAEKKRRHGPRAVSGLRANLQNQHFFSRWGQERRGCRW